MNVLSKTVDPRSQILNMLLCVTAFIKVVDDIGLSTFGYLSLNLKLTLSCIMIKYGQTYIKNLVVSTFGNLKKYLFLRFQEIFIFWIIGTFQCGMASARKIFNGFVRGIVLGYLHQHNSRVSGYLVGKTVHRCS